MRYSALRNRLKSSFAHQGRLQTAPPTAGTHASTSVPTPAGSVASSATEAPLSTATKLEVLDQVLTEVEQQAAVAASPNSLNPPQPATTTYKESIASSNPDISPIETGAGLQYVEQEPTPEIPVEVESYLQQVEQNQDQTPPEISIADGSNNVSITSKTVKKPVIVLPITPEVEKEGSKKSPHWSVRWLVEWSRKIMKMFSGAVIYRETTSS